MNIKDHTKKLMEAAALFFVLFFPLPQYTFENSALTIIGHSIFWRIPALILILLLLGKKPLFRPKTAFLTLAAALPALVLTGFLVSYCAMRTGYTPPDPIKPPDGILGWIAAITLSLSTGFLEEAYFRVYLPRRLMEQNTEKTTRSVVYAFMGSGLIFSLCHAYEGPFGIVNAIMAALVLSLAYIKSSSFPGIALAHGLYNCLVFLSAGM